MVMSFVVALLLAAAPASGVRSTPSLDADSLGTDALSLVARLRTVARARDSLSTLADTSKGTARDYFEESVWQRHVEIHDGVLALTERLDEERARGRDVLQVQGALGQLLKGEWPRFLGQLRRWQSALRELGTASDAATGEARVEIESRTTRQSDRLIEAYGMLADVVLAAERVGIDAAGQRAFLVDGLGNAAPGLVTRLQLARRDRAEVGARLSRDPANVNLRYTSEAAEERFKRATQSLSAAITLMDRMGLDGTSLRVALISATGRMTADVFHWRVVIGLLKAWWAGVVELVIVKAPGWVFQTLVIVLTFFGFRALSRVVRGLVRRAVAHSHASELMRGMLVRLSSRAVMVIGFVVILTQLGVQVAPLLAGLGIAGFVVGFAMQNTLSNFAAGGMILGNQPFDVGDDIEVAGVSGTVKRMNLVSTTILTGDNETLIVPNSAVWGGVIRNRTAQPVRRVDLGFGIGYGDDIEKAERVLQEIVSAEAGVLNDPAPVIRLNQLADSSVNFVVRVWTAREKYWEVYWNLTRAVKLRFDAEGISIPFPQRDVHVNVVQGGDGGPLNLGSPGRKT